MNLNSGHWIDVSNPVGTRRRASVPWVASRRAINPEKAVGTTEGTKDTKGELVTASSRFTRQGRFCSAGKTHFQPWFSCLSCLSWFISTAVVRINRRDSSCPPHRGLRLPLLRSERRRGAGRGGAPQRRDSTQAWGTPLPNPLPVRPSRGEGAGRATRCDGFGTNFRND